MATPNLDTLTEACTIYTNAGSGGVPADLHYPTTAAGYWQIITIPAMQGNSIVQIAAFTSSGYGLTAVYMRLLRVTWGNWRQITLSN